LLTGRDIWTGETLTQLVAQIAYEPMPVPSKLEGVAFGNAYDGWFAKCCARKPEERFASCGEAVEALARVLDLPAAPVRAPAESSQRVAVIASPGLRSSADGFARTETLGRKRPPVAFIAGTLFAAAFLGGAAVWYFEVPKPDKAAASTPIAAPPPPSMTQSTSQLPVESVHTTETPPPASTSAAPVVTTARPPSGTHATAKPHPATSASAHPPSDNDLLGSQH
jgi:hypothetical protein